MKNNIFKNYTIVGEETDSNNDYSVVETNALETLPVGGIKIPIGKKSSPIPSQTMMKFIIFILEMAQ